MCTVTWLSMRLAKPRGSPMPWSAASRSNFAVDDHGRAIQTDPQIVPMPQDRRLTAPTSLMCS